MGASQRGTEEDGGIEKGMGQGRPHRQQRCLPYLENEVMIPSLEADLEASPEPEATTSSGQNRPGASGKIQPS